MSVARIVRVDADPKSLSDYELDQLIDTIRDAATRIDQHLIDLAGERARRILNRPQRTTTRKR